MRAVWVVWALAGCGRVGFAPAASEGNALADSSAGVVDQQPATTDAPAGPPPCTSVNELATSFDGTAASYAWMPVMDPGVTLTESANHLVIQLPDSTIASGGYNSVCAYDLRGQRVWVTIATTPRAGTMTDMYLGVGTPSKALGVNITQGSVDAYTLIGNYTALASVPYNASQHKIFQIREAGGQVFWEVSADGTTFTTLHSGAPPFAVSSVNVFIFADAYAQVTLPGQAEFANFGLP